MAIPFSLPSDDTTIEQYRSIHQLLMDLTALLHALMTRNADWLRPNNQNNNNASSKYWKLLLLIVLLNFDRFVDREFFFLPRKVSSRTGSLIIFT